MQEESRPQPKSEDNRQDTSTDAGLAPIRRADSFDSIINNSTLLAAVKRLGFTEPTDVQRLTLPALRTFRDAIVQAKTGSGKTLAYILPLLEQLLDDDLLNAHDTSALVIAPTRELATQIGTVLGSLGLISPTVLIGGMSLETQREQLRRQSSVVIGTPGRLLEMLREKSLRLNRCRHFVLDEADEMLSMGFLEDVRAILSRLPVKRQGVFVSATVPPRVGMLARTFLDNADLLCVDDPSDTLPEIEHLYCQVSGDLLAKPMTLCDLIETYRPRTAIVFCNTKSDTELVEALLRRRGFDARRINSDLSQKQRDRIMQQIRSGSLQLLIATDIAARGLDLDQLDLVVNFSIHEQPELYVHRTGRTGRAGKSGRAISLIGPRDVGFFHHLTKVLPVEFKKMTPPSEDDIVNARTAHIYEILRTQSKEPTQRDLLVASKIITDCGGPASDMEELSEAVAKLAQLATEHLLQSKPPSLEEETVADEPESKKQTREGKRRRQPETAGERDSTKKLFISQGANHGLHDESLRTFVAESCGLAVDNLGVASVREQYSFLTCSVDDADSIIKTLHGREREGSVLTVEVAEQRSPRRRNRRSREEHRRRE